MQTLELHKAVPGWKGTLLRMLPIAKESIEVLASVSKGTRAAEQSAPLDFLGALGADEATITPVAERQHIPYRPYHRRAKVRQAASLALILANLGLRKKAKMT